MLDQAGYLRRYDKHDVLGVLYGQPAQLTHHYGNFDEVTAPGITTIVVAGMGGSALAAEFIMRWLGGRLAVPFIIVRGYDLPAFVGETTLVVASSYSGNTEETVSALAQARERGAQIAVLASGGKLVEAAHEHSLPLAIVPGGLQPRLAVLYGVRALAELLEAIGLLTGIVAELEAVVDWATEQTKPWLADSPTGHNPAKQMAMSLHGHPVVVYGGPTLSLPAMKWKIDANENAKNLAFYNYLPEFNHNEFLGWGHPHPSHLRVVELQSNLDHPQVQKRFEVSNRLLAETMPAPIIVTAQGKTQLEQMIWAILLGDFTMAYLAFLNQVDPTPVPLIEELKRELA